MLSADKQPKSAGSKTPHDAIKSMAVKLVNFAIALVFLLGFLAASEGTSYFDTISPMCTDVEIEESLILHRHIHKIEGQSLAPRLCSFSQRAVCNPAGPSTSHLEKFSCDVLVITRSLGSIKIAASVFLKEISLSFPTQVSLQLKYSITTRGKVGEM
jgi:hypothetical protein